MGRAAVAYYRTSSAANVGEDKDSLPRQRAAVERHAASAGLTIVAEEYDDAVKGDDPVDARPGFRRLLASLNKNGARTILVETASRFARDALVAELGFRQLRGMGLAIIAADSPMAFLDDTPTATFIRQMLAAYSQLEKTMLVLKLRAARERTGRKGGRKPIWTIAPEAVALARSPAMKDLSLRQIAAALAGAGHLTRYGKPYSASAVTRMLYGPP